MNEAQANRVEWEWIDPRKVVDVQDLVTDAHRALESTARSWDAEQRQAVADTLDRVRAQMQELARLVGYEDGSDAPRPAEPLHRRELPAGVKMLARLPDLPDARGQSR
jgi:hypothetical protein